MPDATLSDSEREYIARVVNRHTAAILTMNDTLRDKDERDRMRRTVLDASELLLRRVLNWRDNGLCRIE